MPGGGVHVGRDTAGRGLPLGDELAERLAQFADALPGERGQGEHGRAGFAVLAQRDAVLVEQAPQVVENLLGGLPGSRSTWLRTTRVTSAWPAIGRR